MQSEFPEIQPAAGALVSQLGSAKHIFTKFLSANDLGLTNSHQSGIYMPAAVWPLFLERPGEDGENLERDAVIHWLNGYRTASSFKWYGKSKFKSEYRLTKIRPVFKGNEDAFLGSLLILFGEYGHLKGLIVHTEEEMDLIFDFLGIGPESTGQMYRADPEEFLERKISEMISEDISSFPDTDTLAGLARELHRRCCEIEVRPSGRRLSSPLKDPDAAVIDFVMLEYRIFQYIERILYSKYLKSAFTDLEELLSVSLEIQNRRKSRAGRSLELHLNYIFKIYNLPFTYGGLTEDKKRPDFIFPGEVQYKDAWFPDERLFLLGAKTTCKDRWRQVLSEGSRAARKYLFTLQQGISGAQLYEMEQAGLTPVIPEEYHSRLREEDRSRVLTLSRFIDMVLDANGRELNLFNQI